MKIFSSRTTPRQSEHAPMCCELTGGRLQRFRTSPFNTWTWHVTRSNWGNHRPVARHDFIRLDHQEKNASLAAPVSDGGHVQRLPGRVVTRRAAQACICTFTYDE